MDNLVTIALIRAGGPTLVAITALRVNRRGFALIKRRVTWPETGMPVIDSMGRPPEADS